MLRSVLNSSTIRRVHRSCIEPQLGPRLLQLGPSLSTSTHGDKLSTSVTSHREQRQQSWKRQHSNRKSFLFLAFPAITFGLGTWQVYRLKWKQDLITALEERTSAEPIDLRDEDIQTLLADSKTFDEMEYRRVRITGRFEHSKEVLVGPRSKVETDSSSSGGGLISSRPNSGYNVITAFQLAGTRKWKKVTDNEMIANIIEGRSVFDESDPGWTDIDNFSILVNRGWVPPERAAAETRSEGNVDGETTIVACIRKGENRVKFTPQCNENSQAWHYLDVPSFARMLGTELFLLDLDKQSSIPGGPVAGQTRVFLRNEHVQYIVTWYGLTFALLFLIWKTRKPTTRLIKQRR